MNETFFPLLPHAAQAAEPSAAHRLKVLAGDQTAQPFQALASGLSTVHGCKPEKPSVTLERDGDRVTRVRIHCPCGRLLELECVY